MDKLISSLKKIASEFPQQLGFVNSAFLKEQLEKKELIYLEDIGFINYHHRKDSQTTIYDFAIAKKYHHQGYGRLLFYKLLCESIEKGKSRIFLKVTEDNQPAQVFYTKLGFKTIGEEQGRKRKLIKMEYKIQLPFLFYCGGNGSSKYDRIASQLNNWRVGTNSKQTLNNSFPIDFVDNDWARYDHQRHLEYVKVHKPLLATVKDLETVNEIRLVFSYAEELSKYCGRVLIIPKIKPKQIGSYLYFINNKAIDFPYWLAFSVPTSYGSAECHNSIFKNNFIHLLGGSPTAQSSWNHYFNTINSKVVSVDGNYSMRISKYGKSIWQGNDSGKKIRKGCYASFEYSLKKQAEYWYRQNQLTDLPLFMNI